MLISFISCPEYFPFISPQDSWLYTYWQRLFYDHECAWSHSIFSQWNDIHATWRMGERVWWLLPHKQSMVQSCVQLFVMLSTCYVKNDLISPLIWHYWDGIFTSFQIKLFSKFRLWKTFFTWRKSITQAKYKDAQELVRKKLFVLNSVLQKALLEMRQMCLKLLDINFFDKTCMQVNPLFQFIENQVHLVIGI